MNVLILNNTGGFDIDVTSEVNDTADDLFVDGLMLDSAVWSEYSTLIAEGSSDTADVVLAVPVNYAGSTGPKEGTLMFWAQKA